MGFLGNTTTPTAGWDWPGSGYEFGSFYTVPAGSGIMVTDIFAFMATPSGASNGYVCVWDSTGGGSTLLASGFHGALPAGSQSAGGQQWIGVTLSSPVYLPGGQGIYIGGYGTGNIVFSSGVGGTSRVKSVGSGGPANFSGNVASGIGVAGAYLAYDPISAPTLTSDTPNHGVPGNNIAIVGSGFTYATAASVLGVGASFSITDDAHMTVTVPSVGAGSGNIVITNPAGTGSIAFTVVAAPTINSDNPNHGIAGTSVALNGSHYTYVTGVTLNGVTCSFSITDDSDITVTVPGGTGTGTFSLTVTNAAGSASINFTVVAAPTISSVTPNIGVAGTSVAVVGTGFQFATGVDICGAGASFSITDDAHLTATVPSGATPGPGTLVVHNAAGSASIAFTAGGIARVRRSGSWVVGVVSTRRSGAWVQQRVRVRRSGAWVDAS